MKKTVVKAALFIIGFWLLALIMQILLFSTIRRINVGDYGVLNSIADGSINAEMIICGSSRGYVHYNPEILTEMTGMTCYNISANGSDLALQLALLRWYVERNRPPRILVQNIDVFIGDIVRVVYDPFKYLPYLDSGALYQGLMQINWQWWFHRYVPCTNLIYVGKDFQREFIKEIYQFYIIKNDYLIRGYCPRDISGFSDAYRTIFLKEHPSGFQDSLTQDHREYLTKLIDFCRNKNIQLIFVISPEYQEFMALQRNRQEIIDYYLRLSNNNGLLFYDFSQSKLCGDRTLFYNFTHMNSRGANEFSRVLGMEFRKNITSK